MAAIRVFGLSKQVPTLRDCFGFAAGAGEGVLLALDADDIAHTEVDSHNWREARVLYREDAPPLAVRLLKWTDDGTAFVTTLNRFIAALNGSVQTEDMRAVRYHLSEARSIVEVTPPKHADADALTAAAWFTRLFVERYEGLLQVDGEGFYDREGNLAVPLVA